MKESTYKEGSYQYVDSSGNVWEIINLYGEESFVKKIDSTHFEIASREDIEKGKKGWSHHVSEFSTSNPDFERELRKWLRGQEMIGGKTFQEGTNMKTIEIEEDFRVPGTDIIIEAGDTLQVSTIK
jgi:hypothetical protein